MYPMVVNKGDDADHLSITLPNFLLDEMVANQVTNRLGSILISNPCDTLVEGGQEIFFQRNAKTGEMMHGYSGSRVTRNSVSCQTRNEATALVGSADCVCYGY